MPRRRRAAPVFWHICHGSLLLEPRIGENNQAS